MDRKAGVGKGKREGGSRLKREEDSSVICCVRPVISRNVATCTVGAHSRRAEPVSSTSSTC